MSISMTSPTSGAAKKAAFVFKEYKFTRSMIDFSLLANNEELVVSFSPTGSYSPKTGEFHIRLHFTASNNEVLHPIIEVECEAIFVFEDALPYDVLPDYFFTNSTAILYPYIRAFVSTLTLQSNYEPFVLPTLNVAALGKELRSHTSVID